MLLFFFLIPITAIPIILSISRPVYILKPITLVSLPEY